MKNRSNRSQGTQPRRRRIHGAGTGVPATPRLRHGNFHIGWVTLFISKIINNVTTVSGGKSDMLSKFSFEDIRRSTWTSLGVTEGSWAHSVWLPIFVKGIGGSCALVMEGEIIVSKGENQRMKSWRRLFRYSMKSQKLDISMGPAELVCVAMEIHQSRSLAVDDGEVQHRQLTGDPIRWLWGRCDFLSLKIINNAQKKDRSATLEDNSWDSKQITMLIDGHLTPSTYHWTPNTCVLVLAKQRTEYIRFTQEAMSSKNRPQQPSIEHFNFFTVKHNGIVSVRDRANDKSHPQTLFI